MIAGKAFLRALTEGKEKAIEELDNQIKKFPDLQSKLSTEYYQYEYFDRHAIVFDEPVQVKR